MGGGEKGGGGTGASYKTSHAAHYTSSSNSLNTAACICDLMPLRTPFLLKFSFNTSVSSREGKGAHTSIDIATPSHFV